MKRLIRTAAVLLTLTVAVPVLAQSRDLAPGGIAIQGGLDSVSGTISMTLQIASPSVGQATVEAVEVFAEPSGTLLAALVNESAPMSVLQVIQKQGPLAWSTISQPKAQLNMRARAPFTQISGLRVQYLVEKDGVLGVTTLADIQLNSPDAFDFTITPNVGGKNQVCGWCGEYFCGCMYCIGNFFTLCCPYCDMVCGYVSCTP